MGREKRKKGRVSGGGDGKVRGREREEKSKRGKRCGR